MTTKPEYNLDFFQAMAALKEGKIVANKVSDKYTLACCLENGEVKACNLDGTGAASNVEFLSTEINGKWRIVEPEKCWLLAHYGDKREISFDGVTREGIRLFAHEAIKRIENKISVTNARGAIEILKDLIGESK